MAHKSCRFLAPELYRIDAPVLKTMDLERRTLVVLRGAVLKPQVQDSSLGKRLACLASFCSVKVVEPATARAWWKSKRWKRASQTG